MLSNSICEKAELFKKCEKIQSKQRDISHLMSYADE